MKPAHYAVYLDLVPCATTMLYRATVTRSIDGDDPLQLRGTLAQTPMSAIRGVVDIVRYLRKEGVLPKGETYDRF